MMTILYFFSPCNIITVLGLENNWDTKAALYGDKFQFHIICPCMSCSREMAKHNWHKKQLQQRQRG